jgi:hypothetical protein
MATLRQYGKILRRVVAELGEGTALAELDPRAVCRLVRVEVG